MSLNDDFDERIKKLMTLTEIMEAIGVKKDSVGWEVCKPVIGSILASLWNEHIMNPAHHAYVYSMVSHDL